MIVATIIVNSYVLEIGARKRVAKNARAVGMFIMKLYAYSVISKIILKGFSKTKWSNLKMHWIQKMCFIPLESFSEVSLNVENKLLANQPTRVYLRDLTACLYVCIFRYIFKNNNYFFGKSARYY